MSGLGARDVEANDTGIAPAHRELGDLAAMCRGAHGAQNRADRESGARRPGLETSDNRCHHLVEGEPRLPVQLGREAHLGVHHAISGEVLGAFPRHSLERVGVLHDTDGVREGLEVEDEVVALGAPVEPTSQLANIGGRQRRVTELRGELDDGGRSETAVEVIVE